MSWLSKEVEPKFVHRAFLVKFGNAYIIPRTKAKEIDVHSLIDRIEACANASPQVQKVERLSIPPVEDFHFEISGIFPDLEKIESLAFTPIIKVKINLPKKNQWEASLLSSLYGARTDITTNFEVLFDGRIYEILREVDMSKAVHAGAPDIRDVFLNIMEKDKSWEIKSTGPNPLRQDFFFVYLKDNEETKQLIGKMYKDKWKICFYLPQKELRNLYKFLGNTLFRNSLRLDCYYSAVFQRTKLVEIVENLNDIHRLIQDVLSKTLGLPFWGIHRHYKNARELERLISKHYSLLLDYSTNVQILKKYTQDSEESLLHSFIFNHFVGPLINELKYEKVDVDTFTKCVDYAREVVQKSYAIKVTLLGALIGVVGTIIGTLVLRSLGL